MRLRPIFLLTIATFALTACGASTENAVPDSDEGNVAVQSDGPAGVTIANARLRLPLVAGRPGVVYFDLSNDTGSDLAIAAIHVDGVDNVELHRTVETDGVSSMDGVETIPVAEGETVSLTPGGYHAMLFGVSDALVDGDSVEMTVTFANGDKTSMAVPVSSGADATETGDIDHDGMAGMNHP